MKTEYKSLSINREPVAGSLRRLQMSCVHCYQRMLSRLAAVRARVERDFARTMAGYEQLIKGAMNEAEALAWQTSYPHLVFPELAEEKAAAARQWAAHQWAVRARGRTAAGEVVRQLGS
jgi:hypothetical protein